jgi:hypothetical protein
MSQVTTKGGAVVLSPRGYRAVVYHHASSQSAREDMKPTLVAAKAFVRKEALALGIGAHGEVLGGEKYDAVVHHCRVSRDNAGKLTLITEDV